MIIFFSNLSLESCYWAGFISGDASISTGRIRIEISSKDKILLERFKRDSKFTQKINVKTRLRKKTKCEMALVTINFVKWVDDLNKIYGTSIKNKGYYLPAPNLNNKRQIEAYLCGLIDADGHIKITNLGYLQVQICVSFPVSNWLKLKFKEFYNITITDKSIKDFGSYCTITLCGKKAFTFLQSLNTLPIDKLDRKWSKLKSYDNTDKRFKDSDKCMLPLAKS